jgi:hypothetical protein
VKVVCVCVCVWTPEMISWNIRLASGSSNYSGVIVVLQLFYSGVTAVLE